MGLIITVDCGTTNMRCRLFDGAQLLEEVKEKCGCRNGVFNGSRECMSEALKRGVSALLQRRGLQEADISVILSTGVLASDLGIYYLPHAVAPAGPRESAAAAEMVTLPEICSVPILFIPGIKTLPRDEEKDSEAWIEKLESMSGEECETYGIAKQLGLTGDFVITLPGSYNKIMEVDMEGRITSIRTGMCGEFIAAMAEHTLLKNFVPVPVIRTVIPEKLICGWEYSCRHGVSHTLIKTRMVQLLGDWSKDEAANFFVGAILRDDIMAVAALCAGGRPAVVGGSNPLRQVFGVLLTHAGVKNLTVIDDACANVASSVGALEVLAAFENGV